MSLTELGRVLDHLSGVTWYELAVALGFYASAIGLRALAWRNVLADAYPEATVPYRRILGAYGAGIGVNSVIPFRVGDVVKLFLAHRVVQRSTYPVLISSLVVLALLDSIFAFGYVLYAVATGGFPGFDVLVSRSGSGGEWLARHAWVTAASGIALVIAVVVVYRVGRAPVRRFTHGLARGFAVLRDWPFYPLHVASWQGLGWALELGAFWWFLRAFDVPASLRNAALVQAVQSVAMALPFTASGAGAEQALLVVVFKGVVTQTAVVSFAVGMRGAMIITNLVLGFISATLLMGTVRWRRVVKLDRELVEHVHLPHALGKRLARLVGSREPQHPRD